MIGGLFAPYEPDWLNKAIAELCYSLHGGSGFSFSRADILDMDVGDVEFFLEWLDERRTKESRAIEKAAKSR